MVIGGVLFSYFVADTTYDAYNLFEQVIQRATAPLRLCRRKAMECQRTAMTTTNPVIRSRFFHLAKLGGKWPTKLRERVGPPLPKRVGCLFF